MNTSLVQSTIRDISEGWNHESFALYIPRPIVEVGGEKWRILQKNILTELDEIDRGNGPAAEFVRALDLRTFVSPGYALFETEQGLKSTRLSRRPIAAMVRSDNPYVLPLIADMSDTRTQWVLVLDRTSPRLYLHDGTDLILHSEKMSDVTYADVEEQRLVQDDIFFHASSRGSQGAPRGPSIFHALGADQSRERDKTDEAYYRKVIDALLASLPGQVSRITVFGDPHTVGPFTKLLEPTGIEIIQEHAAGDALTDEHIADVMKKENFDTAQAPHDAVTDRARLRTASASGQVETLYLSGRFTGLEGLKDASDEHLRLRHGSELKEALAMNELAFFSLETGAEIVFQPDPGEKSGSDISGVLRWGDSRAGMA